MRRSLWRTRATAVGSLASALALTLTGAPAGAVAGPVEGTAAGPSALAAALPSFDELPAGRECPAGTSRVFTWLSESFEEGTLPVADNSSGWDVVRGQARTGSYSARSVISAGDAATQPTGTSPYWSMPMKSVQVTGGRTMLRFAIKGDAPAGAAQITVNDTASRITPTSSWRDVTWDVTDAVDPSGLDDGLDVRLANYPSAPATNSTIDIDDVDIYTCTAQSKVRGDLNGDGIADVVTIGDLSLKLWPGTGDLRLQAPRWSGQRWHVDWLGSPGDLNGDGRADMMLRNDDGDLIVSWGNGGGGFPLGYGDGPKLVGTGWQYMSSIVPIGDINQDGLSDVVAIDQRTGLLRRYWFTGPGSALTGGTTIGSGFNSFKHLLTIGDYNGDGRWDVVGILPNGDMRVYPTLANGSLYGHGTRIGTGWFFTHVSSPGDFNRDGHPDVLALDSTGRLFTYPTLGQGKWGTRVLTGTYFNQFQAII